MASETLVLDPSATTGADDARRRRQGASHGWSHVQRERKQALVRAIVAGEATAGPLHAELDLTDRCNVACYFCNQMDTRSTLQMPVERARELIDELVAGGLASVRLSGGGDPLHHKDILGILDHLEERGVVVDQVTTNGVSLTPEVSRRLVDHRAREVSISLNAVDAADYHRMMGVKPALFDRVLENVRHLMAVRRDGPDDLPVVTVQFLLDRENAHRVVEAWELGNALGAERVAICAVQPIPGERIDRARILDASDAAALLPRFVELMRRAGESTALEVLLGANGLGPMLEEARRRAEGAPLVPTAAEPAFRPQDGGCFFAWYSTTVTGNGDVHPCCQLIHPLQDPLGNVSATPMATVWNNSTYQILRREMREVLLEGANREHPRERFQVLQPVCHEPGVCWLKTMYFGGDQEFYGELGAALDQQRAWRRGAGRVEAVAGRLVQRVPSLRPAATRMLALSRPLRAWMTRRLGIPLSRLG